MNETQTDTGPAPGVSARLDRLEIRFEEFQTIARSIIEAQNIILNDVQEIEAILYNYDKVLKLATERKDISAHVARMRERLGRLTIFRPEQSTGAPR